MSIYNILNRRLILPLRDLLFGQKVSSFLDHLEKTQWYSTEQLKEYQNRRLKIVIDHSYKHVPFYREMMQKEGLHPDDISTVEDISKLPILTKDDIRENFPDRIVSSEVDTKKMIYSHSSGSTGEPLQYYYNREAYSIKIAALLRGWSWMGYTVGDKYVKMSQNPRNSTVKKFQDYFNRSYYLFVKELSNESLLNDLEKIKKYKPDFLRSYPDPLVMMVKAARTKGIGGIQLKGINTTGNTLYPEARQQIESFFNCKITDSFSAEGGSDVSQSPTYECYLSSVENAYTEFLDDRGEAVKPGERGRLITTNLWNTAMPFIRYDTQDIVVPANKGCSSGRGLLPIERIEGRDSDVLITPDGKYVIVHIFTIFFEGMKSVDQFQAIQHDERSFTIKIKVNEKFTDSEYLKIKNYWDHYFGTDARVQIEKVAEIPIPATGKRRFLIRNKKVALHL